MKRTDESAAGPNIAQQVEAVWKEAFLLHEIDRDRTLVELGGTSITAAQIAARLSKRLGRPIEHLPTGLPRIPAFVKDTI